MSSSPHCGQPTRADVVAEHPERRPDALARRHLDARLEAAVRLRELAAGVDAARRVVAAADSDSARATISRLPWPSTRDVVGAVGVVLELVVAPAVAAGVEAPLAAVDRAPGAVELVAPGERPAGGRAAAAARAAGGHPLLRCGPVAGPQLRVGAVGIAGARHVDALAAVRVHEAAIAVALVPQREALRPAVPLQV